MRRGGVAEVPGLVTAFVGAVGHNGASLTEMEADMGFLDKLKDQASGLKDIAVDTAAKNKDKIAGGLDKAGDFVDKQTKGKYTDKIATSKVKAKEGLEKLDTAGSSSASEPTSAAGPGSYGTSPTPPVSEFDQAIPAPGTFDPAPTTSDTFGTTPPRPAADEPDATPPPVS